MGLPDRRLRELAADNCGSETWREPAKTGSLARRDASRGCRYIRPGREGASECWPARMALPHPPHARDRSRRASAVPHLSASTRDKL